MARTQLKLESQRALIQWHPDCKFPNRPIRDRIKGGIDSGWFNQCSRILQSIRDAQHYLLQKADPDPNPVWESIRQLRMSLGLERIFSLPRFPDLSPGVPQVTAVLDLVLHDVDCSIVPGRNETVEMVRGH